MLANATDSEIYLEDSDKLFGISQRRANPIPDITLSTMQQQIWTARCQYIHDGKILPYSVIKTTFLSQLITTLKALKKAQLQKKPWASPHNSPHSIDALLIHAQTALSDITNQL